MTKDGKLSTADVRVLISRCFADLKTDVEMTLPHNLSDFELNEQLYCSSEIASAVHTERADGNYGQIVREVANRALAGAPCQLTDLTASSRDILLEAAARAVIEQERLRQFRHVDRLARYEPGDPIFQSNEVGMVFAESATPVAGVTIAEAVDAYLRNRNSNWTGKTLLKKQRHLGYLISHLGGHRELGTLKTADLRAFRDAVVSLRKEQGRPLVRSFAERQTTKPSDRIDVATAVGIFGAVATFLRWCRSEPGYIDSNPADGVRITLPKRPKGITNRRPFDEAELRLLFGSPVFQGCYAKSRRFQSGPHVIRDAYFWLPILAYYTGARAGELVQLHIRDVAIDCEIPNISITEVGGGPAGSDHHKHVKTAAGVRLIPIHPDVLALGFADFVLKRQQRKGTSRRLFSEVAIGRDGQASTTFSKWFGRLLGSVGLDDPSLVLHSLRHQMEDALRNAGCHQYLTDRILGHTDGATSSGYGIGVNLTSMSAALASSHLPLRLINVLGPPE